MSDQPIALREYLYLLRPARLEMVTEGPTPEEEAIIARHFDYLKSLAERGVMVLFGRTQNKDADTFGIAIFRAESDQAAQRIMAGDPAVQAGVMTARLFPYRIALMARSLSTA